VTGRPLGADQPPQPDRGADGPAAGWLEDLVAPLVADCGCELWDLVLAGPRGRRRLRVLIDAPGGVDLERCAAVSRHLLPALEAVGPELGEVELEVSSPGAERRLRGMEDYLRFVGRRVNVRFRTGDSETVVEGRLAAVGDEALVVEARSGPIEVPMADVAEARGAVEFSPSGAAHPQRSPRRRP
jgi:ribosome maturation factor RimP